MTEYEKIEQNVFRINLDQLKKDKVLPCECSRDPMNTISEDSACGETSKCLNRTMNIECDPKSCPIKNHCQNQRFQRLSYANIEIFQTNTKGLGIRAASDIPK